MGLMAGQTPKRPHRKIPALDWTWKQHVLQTVVKLDSMINLVLCGKILGGDQWEEKKYVQIYMQ